MKCPSCGKEAGVGRFCQHCGAPVDFGGATEADAAARTPVHTPTPSKMGEMGFAPGEMFGWRYRIVGMLGQGGMGEVYRADDLKLGHPVALKFLSGKHAKDEALLQRFVGEVRLARQVSHPNVCRVYDIGESDGRHYLSMEYVDGEDLASLLKRIGRLPSDKALEVARQLCAGLAAAHDKGVLHRDLKPANIMLDGRGHARITDFGLAVAAGQESSERGLAGTPAYMAPEQLTGGEVTVRTDLYALGLILYEVFTGKRAIEGRTVAERLKAIESLKTASVTGIAGTDPAVERAILRCLEKEPVKRPESAQAVAAALPGGDPLAAAVAAGETPSPEMVAAAGESGGLSPAVAWACLAAVVLGLLCVAWLSKWSSLHRMVALDKPPEVLAERARQMLGDLGYTNPPSETVHFFQWNYSHLLSVGRQGKLQEAVRSGQPALVNFVYRQSPRPLVPHRFDRELSSEDPPLTQPGMLNLLLDTRGRLVELRAVAPDLEPSSGGAPDPDWGKLFAAAGLDMARFKPAAPQWSAVLHSDTRAAWEGVYPQQPGIAIRVEAAAASGKPVSFSIVDPWTQPAGKDPRGPPKLLAVLLVSAFIAIFAGGTFLCFRNLRLGRGDRGGAAKLAAFMFLCGMARWVFLGQHTRSGYEFNVLVVGVAAALLYAVTAWFVYIALEPYVRRRWPEVLISWSRLLAGRLRDPLVGRDIIVGAVFGVLSFLLSQLAMTVSVWLGQASTLPGLANVMALSEGRKLVGIIIVPLLFAPIVALFNLFFLFLCRVVLRKHSLAVAVWIVLSTVFSLASEYPVTVPAWAVVVEAGRTVLFAILLLRFGLVAVAAYVIVYGTVWDAPLTLDPSAWYAARSYICLATLTAFATYGFFTATAGRRRFSAALLEEE